MIFYFYYNPIFRESQFRKTAKLSKTESFKFYT